jgi:predicted MFS family arabinose efflux permease
MLVSAVIQGLNFSTFTATWLALALHLTSPELGYGVDVVGYLAGLAAVSVVTTPRLGRLADRIGPLRARVAAASVQSIGIALFYPFGWSAWTIVIPLTVINMVGPTIDVSGRMIFLSMAPEIRTRMTTGYIVFMFLGGALGSILGTYVYDRAGWAGTCAMLAAISLSVLGLSCFAYLSARETGRRDAPLA